MLLHSKIVNDRDYFITTEKLVNGIYILSAFVCNELVSKKYIGYTKRQAVKLFKEYLKSKQGEWNTEPMR
jgi:hypothetical protein